MSNNKVSQNDDDFMLIPSFSTENSGGNVGTRTAILQSYSVEGKSSEYDKFDEVIAPHEVFEVVDPSQVDPKDMYSPEQSFQYIPRCRSDDDLSSSLMSNQSDMTLRKSQTDSDLYMRESILIADDQVQQKEKDEKSKRDAKWLGFGAKLGLTILNSEHIQSVIKGPTEDQYVEPVDDQQKFDALIQTDSSLTPKASNINDSEKKSDKLHLMNKSGVHDNRSQSPTKPIHAMWTSPGAAMIHIDNSSRSSSLSDLEVPIDPTINSDQAQNITMMNDNLILNAASIKRKKHEMSSSTSNTHNRLKQRPDPIKQSYQNREREKVSTNASLQLDQTNQVRFNYEERSAPKKPRSLRRPILKEGVKIVLPIFPIHTPLVRGKMTVRDKSNSHYQMCTVIRSERIFIDDNNFPLPCHFHGRNSLHLQKKTNCLSITALMDKSFLRNGKFSQISVRIMDRTSNRRTPRHSKFPIGSCVVTSFGIGILVGWRVEDDCHIVGSLWKKRGAGSALAYLHRSALKEEIEASIGFMINSSRGFGEIVGYKNAASDGKFLMQLICNGKEQGRVIEISRSDVIDCKSAQFIPILEHIREAAKYQLQLDVYESAIFQRSCTNEQIFIDKTLRYFSESFEILFKSFMKAIEEDPYFDKGMKNLLSSIINFLEDFDPNKASFKGLDFAKSLNSSEKDAQQILRIDEKEKDTEEKGFRMFNDLFGGMFHPDQQKTDESKYNPIDNDDHASFSPETYDRIYAFLQTCLRTVAISRSASAGKPHFQMTLSISHEVLLFIRNVIRVQQRNMSQESIKKWKRTFDEFASIFYPIKNRVQKVMTGVSQRLEEHGKIAKLRTIHFFDLILADDQLLELLENAKYDKCIDRLEKSAVEAQIVDKESCSQYHKTAIFIYNSMAPRAKDSDDAVARSRSKITLFAKILKVLAKPRRTLLSLLLNNDIVELIERIMLKVFDEDIEASRILNIFAFNFHTFRHLRLFSNLSITEKLWTPILDAADYEFSQAVSSMPKETKDFIEPISNLFSLGVAQKHRLRNADISAVKWLDFLMHDDAIKIIQELDQKLMMALDLFCKDVKNIMSIMPYYPSIDDDILSLIDEVEIDKVLREAAEAFVDERRFAKYIRQKCVLAISRFLDYLPKMSIPIERREIGDGWVLTCRGKFGKDLTLSDVNVQKENLVCMVMGSGNLLSPVMDQIQAIKNINSISDPSHDDIDAEGTENIEVSVLDHVRELIVNAQQYGCWEYSDNSDTTTGALKGTPLSSVLKCSIELWENLEIDDDELLEIAIRDISYHIENYKEKKLQSESDEDPEIEEKKLNSSSLKDDLHEGAVDENDDVNSIFETFLTMDNDFAWNRRFNPKKDPSVLTLEINKLKCRLDDFLYRIEFEKSNSIFDPVFEGIGSVKIHNLSIKLCVESRKERRTKDGKEETVPVLQLRELDVSLEKVKFQFKETGADWLLNKVVSGFKFQITRLVEANLKEEIINRFHNSLDVINSYIETNPDIFLKVLGITLEDLQENYAWV